MADEHSYCYVENNECEHKKNYQKDPLTFTWIPAIIILLFYSLPASIAAVICKKLFILDRIV